MATKTKTSKAKINNSKPATITMTLGKAKVELDAADITRMIHHGATSSACNVTGRKLAKLIKDAGDAIPKQVQYERVFVRVPIEGGSSRERTRLALETVKKQIKTPGITVAEY